MRSSESHTVLLSIFLLSVPFLLAFLFSSTYFVAETSSQLSLNHLVSSRVSETSQRRLPPRKHI